MKFYGSIELIWKPVDQLGLSFEDGEWVGWRWDRGKLGYEILKREKKKKENVWKGLNDKNK